MTPLETFWAFWALVSFFLRFRLQAAVLLGSTSFRHRSTSPVSATTIGILRYSGSSSQRQHCTKVNVSARQLINKGGTRHPTTAQRTSTPPTPPSPVAHAHGL